MPAIPAESSTAPRACPTANAERAFCPKKRSSTASAVGSYRAIRSHTRAWMRASRRSSASSGPVPITPPSSAASCCPRERTTPKPVWAVPGSMPRTTTIRLILCRAADAFRRSLPLVRTLVAAAVLALAIPASAQAQYRCLGDFSGSLDETPDAERLRFGMYPGGSAGQVGPVGLPAVPEDAVKREAALAVARPEGRDFVIHLYRHFTADGA